MTRYNWRRSADVSQWDIATDASQWRRSIDASQWRGSADASQWEDGAEVTPSQSCNDWGDIQWEPEPSWWRRATRRRQLNSVARRVATVVALRECPRRDVRRMFSVQQQPLQEMTTNGYVGDNGEVQVRSSDCDKNSDGDGSKDGSDGTIESLQKSACSSNCCSSCVCEDRNNNGSMNGVNIKGSDSDDDGLGAYPTFVVPGDNPLGVTDIEDLAEADRRRVRGLARLELTELFTKHQCNQTAVSNHSGAPVPAKQHRFLRLQHRGQAHSAANEDKVDSTEYSITKEANTVRLLRMIRLLTRRLGREDALKTRGLFRVCGSAARVRALRQARPDVVEAAAVASSIDPHDATALLKACLRELPRPLAAAPRDAGRFACLPRVRDETDRLFGLNLLVLLLPSEASSVLRELVELFAKVVSYRDQNQMTLQALATVIAPSLLPAQSPEQLLNDSRDLITAVEMLIKYRNIVWIVPDFTLRQIRRQAPPPLPPPAETAQQRQPHAAMRLLRRIAGGNRQHQNSSHLNRQQHQLGSPLSSPLSSTSSSQSPLSPTAPLDFLTATNSSIIQVRVGSADCTSEIVKSVRVTPATTAADVVLRVGFNSNDSNLHEVGGNLCERRLQPKAVVAMVRRTNPGCGWWVK